MLIYGRNEEKKTIKESNNPGVEKKGKTLLSVQYDHNNIGHVVQNKLNSIPVCRQNVSCINTFWHSNNADQNQASLYEVKKINIKHCSVCMCDGRKMMTDV